MDNDIVPALLAAIEEDFDQRTYDSSKLKRALKQLESKRATYQDVSAYAIEIGEILADVFKEHVKPGILPDGRMYFNIADRLLNPTMKKNHELVVGYARDVQAQLNVAANIRIKPQVPALNQDRIDGMINRLSSEAEFEQVQWMLDEPVINYTQSIVDDVIKANVLFHAKAGLRPTITRTVSGHKPCAWCRSLAGTYDYGAEPKDLYRRHDRCRCLVVFDPKTGKGRTTVHDGSDSNRKYIKDEYGNYALTKEERVKRAKKKEKTEAERKAIARQKRIDTWAKKKRETK